MADDLQYTLETPSAGRDVTAVMGRRTLAWVLDLVLYLAFAIALFVVLAEYVEVPGGSALGDACERLRLLDEDAASGCITLNDRAYITSSADNGLQTLASFGYFAVFVLMQGIVGASPGKALTGLRVVNAAGRRCGVGRSLGRTLLWVVDAAPWFAPIVGFVTGLTTTGHRRIGDMATGTYVIARSDMGHPVTTGAAVAPPAQGAWGAPPPTWPASTPPASPPPPSASPPPPSAPPSVAPPSVAPPSVAPPPNVPSVSDLSPEVSGVPAEQPAPPPMPDNAPPTWAPPTLDGADGPQMPTSEPPTIPEIDEPVDIAPPDVAPNDDWWSGPEASSSTAESELPAEPEMPAWEDPTPEPDTIGDSWAPPTTPAGDIEETDNTSPTAGPAPFTAPGADPVSDAPPAPEPAPRPPPQWDPARNTYIQWEPDLQQWLQWDDGAQRWKDIDT